MSDFIRKKIKLILLEKNLSINDLVTKCTLPRNSILNIIYGRSSNENALKDIANALGVNISYFSEDEAHEENNLYLDPSEYDVYRIKIPKSVQISYNSQKMIKCLAQVSKILESKSISDDFYKITEYTYFMYYLFLKFDNFEKASAYFEGTIDQLLKN